MGEVRAGHISILGGGLAGLAAGYYLSKAGQPFSIYEARGRIGGNCVTLKHGEFYLDSGPHRFHDKDSATTADMLDLMGDDLKKIAVPSQIYNGGKYVNFPISPLNLMRSLGLRDSARVGYQVLRSNIINRVGSDHNLKHFATHIYGRTIAERFLLNYSEKLLGTAAENLSSVMARSRLRGLGLQTIFREVVSGKDGRSEHLDGSFYYPRLGIGMIPDRLGQVCGQQNIQTCSKVTRLNHDGKRICSIRINGTDEVPVDSVISTLPLDYLVKIMDPGPDDHIVDLAEDLRFRDLILVALFVARDRVTANATVYFPDEDFIFTRAYEPKNRSPLMSPPGRTSLIVEIPCDAGDASWTMGNDRLMELVARQLVRIGWISRSEIIAYTVERVRHAYPVLEVGAEEKAGTILRYLEGFENLQVCGRNGRFAYASIHDLLISGREIAQRFAA